jgi:gas vesicle protein
MSNRGFSGSAVVLSFLMGSLVGAVTAVLFAPQEGRRTREQLRDLTDDWKERSDQVGTEWRGRAQTLIDRGKEVFEEKKRVFSSAAHEGKDAMQQEKERLEAAPEHEMI